MFNVISNKDNKKQNEKPDEFISKINLVFKPMISQIILDQPKEPVISTR